MGNGSAQELFLVFYTSFTLSLSLTLYFAIYKSVSGAARQWTLAKKNATCSWYEVPKFLGNSIYKSKTWPWKRSNEGIIILILLLFPLFPVFILFSLNLNDLREIRLAPNSGYFTFLLCEQTSCTGYSPIHNKPLYAIYLNTSVSYSWLLFFFVDKMFSKLALDLPN